MAGCKKPDVSRVRVVLAELNPNKDVVDAYPAQAFESYDCE